MLLGLVRPDAGEVLLLGRRSSDPRSRSAVGYLPELFRYQPWLTAAEVLDLHVRLARVPVSLEERRESLGLVGFARRGRERGGGVSHGLHPRLGPGGGLGRRPRPGGAGRPARAPGPP